MKRYRRFSAIVSLILLISLVTGCTWIGHVETPPATTTTPTTTTPTTTAPVTVEFPLEEEVTLVLTTGIRGTVINLQKNLADNRLWNDLYERTNVKIEIKECPDIDTLSSLLKTDNYGDIILCYNNMKGMNETVLSGLIEQNKLLALNPYINNRELMPHLNSRVWDERPEAKGNFTSPDGNIYVLGSYNGDKSNYLENTCWVNKTWVEDAGMKLEDLATIEGLEKFFAWVEKNDANGNGDPDDELPYMCYMYGGNSIETLLGMWGVPTKDQSNEGYIFLEDGEVKFAPLTQNWVDFMTTMKKWFDNGWCYENYLLGHDGDGKPLYEYKQNQYVRDNGEPERIAFWVGTGAPARNNGTKMPEGTEMCEYVSILPPKVAGYEIRWYMHPGFMGIKGYFGIAANCKYPEIALAWMDQFYSLEVTIRNDYGEPDSGWYILDDDGKIVVYTTRNDPSPLIMPSLDSIIPRFPNAITEDDYKNVFSTDGATQKKRDAYAQYQDVINTEVWPRPYMTSSALSEHTALYAEISQIVAKYRNDWLSGKGDLNTDRGRFEAELKAAGVDRMVALMQEAYDVFRNAIDEQS